MLKFIENESIGRFFSVVIVGVVVLFLFDVDEWWTNDNTVYGVSCESKSAIENPTNKCRWSKITYTADSINHYILFTLYDPKISRPNEKLVNRLDGDCNVKNRHYWTCHTSKMSYVMFDGDFEIHPIRPVIFYKFYSKWWWFLKGGKKAFEIWWG